METSSCQGRSFKTVDTDASPLCSNGPVERNQEHHLRIVELKNDAWRRSGEALAVSVCDSKTPSAAATTSTVFNRPDWYFHPMYLAEHQASRLHLDTQPQEFIFSLLSAQGSTMCFLSTTRHFSCDLRIRCVQYICTCVPPSTSGWRPGPQYTMVSVLHPGEARDEPYRLGVVRIYLHVADDLSWSCCYISFPSCNDVESRTRQLAEDRSQRVSLYAHCQL